MEEHDRYARNLVDIIGYEKAPTSIVKRAGKALGLMHVKCFSRPITKVQLESTFCLAVDGSEG